jgi:DNA (cytosine-5)-methyltransferase 1
VKQLPPSVRLVSLTKKAGNTISRKNKGKAICNGDDNNSYKRKEEPQEDRLATLDIFAGCGGLSEGLQQSGTKIFFSIVISHCIIGYAISCIDGV